MVTIRFFLLLFISLLLAGCSGSDPQQSAKKKPNKEHIVVTETAVHTPVSIEYTRTGTVKLRQIARLYAQEEGTVSSLSLYEGDAVKQGDLLLKIDDTLLQAEYRKAIADAQQASLDLKRIQNLKKKNVASEEELSRAKTELSIAQAEVDILKTRIDYTRVTAPFDGILSERLVEPEDLVKKQSHLLTLINPDSLYIHVMFSEFLLPQIETGMPVTVRIDALGNAKFSGHISRIHPTVEETTRQAIVEISLDQPDKQILAGQFARVTFQTRALPRIMLPFVAIQHDRKGEFVYRLVEDKAVKTSVKSGIKIGDRVEISEGLESGQAVIIRGFLGLSDGKTVKAVSEDRQ